MTVKNPRGGGVISVIMFVVIAVVAAPLLAIIAPAVPAFFGAGIAELVYGAAATGVACATGVICNGGGGGSGGSGGGTGYAGDICTSAANACGMTNNGTIVDVGGGNGQCNADVPPNSACPPPVIAQGGGFYASPATIGPGGQTTLHWNASNSTSCSISGDNGFAYSGTTSGSISTGVLSQTTLFTITCENGAGGSSSSASTRVIVDPQYKEI